VAHQSHRCHSRPPPRALTPCAPGLPLAPAGRANCVRDALSGLQDLQSAPVPAPGAAAPPLGVGGRIATASFAKLYAFFSAGG
jgi:hypothetical protein